MDRGPLWPVCDQQNATSNAFQLLERMISLTTVQEAIPLVKMLPKDGGISSYNSIPFIPLNFRRTRALMQVDPVLPVRSDKFCLYTQLTTFFAPLRFAKPNRYNLQRDTGVLPQDTTQQSADG